MGDFNHRHPRVVEPGGNCHHLRQRDLMLLGVHAVAQAHVVQRDFSSVEIHYATSARTGSSVSLPAKISSANISPVRAAAAVMMSRLPAYLGR